MKIELFKKTKLPQNPGVYLFRKGNKILYIGKATSLKDMVKSYFAKDLIQTRGPLLVDMVFHANKIDFQATDTVLEAIIRSLEIISFDRTVIGSTHEETIGNVYKNQGYKDCIADLKRYFYD